MDCSLPGSSVHGIFQARVVEWGAIAFSSKSSREKKEMALGKRNLRNYNFVDMVGRCKGGMIWI